MAYFYEIVEKESAKTEGYCLRQARVRVETKEQIEEARVLFAPYFEDIETDEHVVEFTAGEKDVERLKMEKSGDVMSVFAEAVKTNG